MDDNRVIHFIYDPATGNLKVWVDLDPAVSDTDGQLIYTGPPADYNVGNEPWQGWIGPYR